MLPWYIDSWAVYDGLAFASKRKPDSIDSNQTVFLAVPDLEPVPIGRISTSLLATRFNFQQGFRNREGAEIAFSSLAQVRETVRRGYLAGGIGPGPGAEAVPPVQPAFPGGDSARGDIEPAEPGAKHYEKHLHDHTDHNFSDLADPGRRIPLLNALQSREFTERVWPVVSAFAEASMLSWCSSLSTAADQDRQRAGLYHWVATLETMQLLGESPRDLIGTHLDLFEHRGTLDLLEAALHNFGSPSSRHSRQGAGALIYEVPCPLRPKWHPGIRTLSDKLLLALSVRDYFQYNSALPEFVPALLAALFQVANHVPLFSVGHFRRDEQMAWAEREKLLKLGLEWLKRELPQVSLPSDAEAALEDFAWGQLGRNHVI